MRLLLTTLSVRIGDIGTYSNDSIPDILDGMPIVQTNLKRDLLAAHQNGDAKAEGNDRLFVKGAVTQIVPVGRSKGVGTVFGWRVPSFFVWLIKGRDYMISKAPSKIDGSEWPKEL